jgi:hypothetical protein
MRLFLAFQRSTGNRLLTIFIGDGIASAMPMLKCTDPECGEEWFVHSELGFDSECPECGAPSRALDAYDDEDDQPEEVVAKVKPAARMGFARRRAISVLRDHGVTTPPVPVEKIATGAGFEIRDKPTLGALRGRLVGNVIELVAADHPWVKRFSIGHELGHHFLETTHADGSTAEQEANNFANELLVPGTMLRTAILETPQLEELIRLFQASRPVVRIAVEHYRLTSNLIE